jgi:hypothetical protein
LYGIPLNTKQRKDGIRDIIVCLSLFGIAFVLMLNIKPENQINMETKKIGAWKKQTSKGEVVSFTIEGKRYSMWVNTYKKEDKHPDFNIIEDKPYNNENNTKTTEAGDLPF